MSNSKRSLKQIKDDLEFAKEKMNEHNELREKFASKHNFHKDRAETYRHQIWKLKEEFDEA